MCFHAHRLLRLRRPFDVPGREPEPPGLEILPNEMRVPVPGLVIQLFRKVLQADRFKKRRSCAVLGK